MGSLAQLLGPTPAELEARQRKLEQGKAKMAAWTGLFDGLRQLGNLYYATKGATPQQFTDPYKQVEQTYQDATKRADDLDTYRRQYTQQLYALRRQAGEDRRKDILAEAQANYYNSRDDKLQSDAELAKKKAITIKELKNGSLVSFDPSTGELTELKPTDPLYVEYMKARTGAANRSNTGGSKKSGKSSGSGSNNKETISWTDEKGVTHRKTVETQPAATKSGNSGGKGGSTKGQKISTGVNWKTKK
jgi:hypothetical protein